MVLWPGWTDVLDRLSADVSTPAHRPPDQYTNVPLAAVLCLTPVSFCGT